MTSPSFESEINVDCSQQCDLNLFEDVAFVDRICLMD